MEFVDSNLPKINIIADKKQLSPNDLHSLELARQKRARKNVRRLELLKK